MLLKLETNKRFQHLLEFSIVKHIQELLQSLSNIPKKAYDFIAGRHHILRFYPQHLTSYAVVYINYPKVIFITFLFMPRVITMLMFLLDIFYYNRFQSIPLLLIKIYLYMIYFQCEHEKDFYAKHLDFEYLTQGIRISIKREPPNIIDALNYDEMLRFSNHIINTWIICKHILRYIKTITDTENHYGSFGARNQPELRDAYEFIKGECRPAKP